MEEIFEEDLSVIQQNLNLNKVTGGRMQMINQVTFCFSYELLLCMSVLLCCNFMH